MHKPAHKRVLGTIRNFLKDDAESKQPESK